MRPAFDSDAAPWDRPEGSEGARLSVLDEQQYVVEGVRRAGTSLITLISRNANELTDVMKASRKRSNTGRSVQPQEERDRVDPH